MSSRSFRVASMLCLMCLCLALVPACSSGGKADSSSSASMGVVNTHCPMMSDHEVDPTVEGVEYHGYKVGFCCAGCINGWNNKSDADKQAYIDAQLKGNMGAVGEAKGDCHGEGAATCPVTGEAAPATLGSEGGSCCPESGGCPEGSCMPESKNG